MDNIKMDLMEIGFEVVNWSEHNLQVLLSERDKL
jgi:hypothetical protein